MPLVLKAFAGMQAQNHHVIVMDQYFNTSQTKTFAGPVGRVMINPNATIGMRLRENIK